MSLTWNGDHIERQIDDDLFRGLLLAGQHLGSESQALVPIEEHTLEESMSVTGDRVAMEVVVSYDTPYAARQHEETGWRHDSGRQAKYLEQPMHTEQSAMLHIIARAVEA